MENQFLIIKNKVYSLFNNLIVTKPEHNRKPSHLLILIIRNSPDIIRKSFFIKVLCNNICLLYSFERCKIFSGFISRIFCIIRTRVKLTCICVENYTKGKIIYHIAGFFPSYCCTWLTKILNKV